MKNKISLIICLMISFGFTIIFTTCFSTPQSSNLGQPPTFTIINNTGYTVQYVYVSRRSNDSWGKNWLRSDLRKGQSISWYYSDTFPAEEVYDTRLVDSNGFTYTRANCRFTENGQLTFTKDHADAKYFQENFTPSFLWSTGANQQNFGIRTVNIATARAEILRLYKLYNRIWFSWDSDNHYTTRKNYQDYVNRQYEEYRRLNNKEQVFLYSWTSYWLNNNDQFAYAYISELPDLKSGKFEWYRSVLVKIVNGNDVVSMSFANIDLLGYSLPTSDDNRRIIEGILNDYMK